jgi:hypothetical protein
MTERKKESKNRQTKAGLLEKNSNKSSGITGKTSSKKDPANTPKISKDKAEEPGDERPLH